MDVWKENNNNWKIFVKLKDILESSLKVWK